VDTSVIIFSHKEAGIVKKHFTISGAVVMIGAIFVLAMLDGQSNGIQVEASEEVQELMSQKGPDLYIFMGRYRGT